MPEITVGRTTNVTASSATANITTNKGLGETASYAYCLATGGGQSPDIAQIRNNGSRVSVTAEGAVSVPITGISGSSPMTVFCVHEFDDEVSAIASGGVFTPASTGDRAWAYKAVPYPIDLPYDPFTMPAPTKAQLWPNPDQEVAGHYYVCPTCPGASNSNTYGTPNAPRSDMPNGSGDSASPFGNSFDAGSVIMLAGDLRQDQDFGSASIDWNPRFNCSAGDFCWWLSDPSNPAKVDGLQVFLVDSEYLAIDGIDFDSAGPSANRQTAISMGRSGQGSSDTKHIVIRNNTFQNMPYASGGGGLIGISGRGEGRHTHNVFVYNNTFKNNGGGYSWITADNDHHGILVSSTSNRVWIIENECVKGDSPDPADGVYKCLGGNFVQTGGNKNDENENRLIFVAGNTNLDGGMRQAFFHSKNASDLIVSGNFQDRNYEDFGGADTGTCAGGLYEFGYYLFIENECVDVNAGWMRTGSDSDAVGPIHIYGNLIRNQLSNNNSGWNRCGVSLWANEPSYAVEFNTFENSECAFFQTLPPGTARSASFSNNLINGTRNNELTIEIGGGDLNGNVQIRNNHIYDDTGGFNTRFDGDSFASVSLMNDNPSASGNVSGNPNLDGSYSPAQSSNSIDAAAPVVDIRAYYIDRFTADPLFPGDPAVWWPETDLNDNPRTVGSGTDIGAVERQ